MQRCRALRNMHGFVWTLLACLFTTPWVGAQPASAPSEPTGSARFHFAADASYADLFVAVSTAEGARIFHRTRFGDFDHGIHFPGAVRELAVAGDRAFVFFADHSIYELSDSWSRIEDLPNHVQPIAVAAWDRSLYVLIPSADARGLRVVSPEAPQEDEERFEPSDPETLSILVYEGRRWRVLTECPLLRLATATSARLLAREDSLFLIAADKNMQLLGNRFEPRSAADSGAWTTLFTLGVPRLRNFWVTDVSEIVTIVAAQESEGGQTTQQVFRLLPDPGFVSGISPRTITFVLEPGPDSVTGVEPARAFGFNDHLVFLYDEGPHAGTLRFARAGEPPIEKTIALPSLLAEVRNKNQLSSVIRFAMFLLLLGVFTGLFVFRRQTLQSPPRLPPQFLPAYAMQRLGAGVIDFAPFALIWSNVLRVDIQPAMSELLSWAGSVTLPQHETLLWWAATVISYATYALIMELVVRKTAGKAILKILVIGDRGVRASTGQVFIRNLMRLIELAPPFWILGFLVVLTPRRQRVGDVFAQTAVVQVVPTSRDSNAANEPIDSESKDES